MIVRDLDACDMCRPSKCIVGEEGLAVPVESRDGQSAVLVPGYEVVLPVGQAEQVVVMGLALQLPRVVSAPAVPLAGEVVFGPRRLNS